MTRKGRTNCDLCNKASFASLAEANEMVEKIHNRSADDTKRPPRVYPCPFVEYGSVFHVTTAKKVTSETLRARERRFRERQDRLNLRQRERSVRLGIRGQATD